MNSSFFSNILLVFGKNFGWYMLYFANDNKKTSLFVHKKYAQKVSF